MLFTCYIQWLPQVTKTDKNQHPIRKQPNRRTGCSKQNKRSDTKTLNLGHVK